MSLTGLGPWCFLVCVGVNQCTDTVWFTGSLARGDEKRAEMDLGCVAFLSSEGTFDLTSLSEKSNGEWEKMTTVDHFH